MFTCKETKMLLKNLKQPLPVTFTILSYYFYLRQIVTAYDTSFTLFLKNFGHYKFVCQYISPSRQADGGWWFLLSHHLHWQSICQLGEDFLLCTNTTIDEFQTDFTQKDWVSLFYDFQAFLNDAAGWDYFTWMILSSNHFID